MRTEATLPYRVRWDLLLWPSLVFSILLFVLPQGFFISMSLYRNLGFGRIADSVTLDNYLRVLTGPLYLSSLGLTLQLALAATLICLVFGLPTAYVLARARSSLASFLVSVLLISSFISVVIKVLGLIVILGQSGLVNVFLRSLGILDAPIQMLNNRIGVLVGLIHYTLPFFVILLFGMIQTVPRSLEEAAEIHGATRVGVFRRVLIPLVWPGLVAGGLTVFNMSAGVFTTAVLLGGGRVLTLPVLIQRKVMLDVDYPLGSALSTVLLLVVFLLNIVATVLLMRAARWRRAAT